MDPCHGCHIRRVDMKALARYQLILLGKQRHSCEQLAQGRCPTMPRPGIEPTICRSRVQDLTTTPPSWCSSVRERCTDVNFISTTKSCNFCLFVIFPDKEPHVLLTSVKKLKSRLSDLIEPDFGLLDQLLSMEVLNRRQYDDVRYDKRAPYRRSEAVLDLLTSEDLCSKFLKALQLTGQQHVVNLILQNGGRNQIDVVTYLLIEQIFEISCFLFVFDHRECMYCLSLRYTLTLLSCRITNGWYCALQCAVIAY